MLTDLDNKKRAKFSGQVLIIALVLMLLVSALAFAIFQSRFIEWQSYKKNYDQIQALYIADAGLEQGIYLLRRLGGPVWEYGNPDNSWVDENTLAGASDLNMFGVILNGKYPINLTFDELLVTLVSPPITLPAGTQKLRFFQWYETQATQDGGWLVLSTDDGKSWTEITSPTPAYTSYYNNNSGNTCYGGKQRDAGGSPAWESVSADLSGGKIVRIGFRFYSNVDTTYAGWYIDDVCVSSAAGCTGTIYFNDNFENGVGNWTHEILINSGGGFTEEFPANSNSIYHITFDPRFISSDTWVIRSTGSTGDYSRTVEAKLTVHGSSPPYQVKIHHYKEVM